MRRSSMNSTTCNEAVVNSTCDNETSAGGGDSKLNESLWDLPVSDAVAGFIASLYMILFLVAFSWNLCVIVFMLVNRKLLREPSSIFLFCLAIVDFMEAVSSIPFYIATLIGGGWIFGDTDDMRMDFCKAVGFFLSTFLSVSIHILAIIAFDRFLYIVCAFQYPRLLKPWRAWLLVFVCCIPAVIVASTPLYGFGEFFFFNDFGVCLFHWRGELAYVVVFCLENMIFIAAIVVFTSLTYFYVRRYLRIREKRKLNLSNLNLNSIQSVTTEEERVAKEHRAKRRTLTRLFLALLITQLICFAPGLTTAFVGLVIGSFDDVPNIVFFIDLLFVISNAAVNPIILTCVRRKIRRKLMSPLVKAWRALRCVEDTYDVEVQPAEERPSFNRQTTIESVLNVRVPEMDSLKYAPPVKHNVSDSGNSTGSSAPSSCEYTAHQSPIQTEVEGGFRLPRPNSIGTPV